MNLKTIPFKFWTYLKEVRIEVKKVNWPSREETVKYTLIVIGVCLVTAAFLGGVDYILKNLLNKFI